MTILPVLVLFDGWASLFRDRVVPWRIAMSERVRAQFEREALPPFIAGRRWFAGKGQSVRRVELADYVEWKSGTRSWLVALARVESAEGDTQTYFLPLTLAWEDRDEETLRTLGPLTVAKARQQAQVGVIGDAFARRGLLSRARRRSGGRSDAEDRARRAFASSPRGRSQHYAGDDVAKLAVSMPGAQGSNTIVSLGDRLFLKAYRRVSVGRESGARDRPLPDRRRLHARRSGCRERGIRRATTAAMRRWRSCRRT